jgi:hypothetical protein
MGMSKTWTALLHSQSYPVVERYVKTDEKHLRKVLLMHQHNFYKGLPIFLLAYIAYRCDIYQHNVQERAVLPCDLCSEIP